MTTPEIVMWAVVCGIGLPAVCRNPTALALSLSWLAGELTWMATGNNLPLSVYVMADIGVIAVIYAKSISRVGPKYYPSAWQHAKSFVTDLTWSDRFIVGIFLLGAWPTYAVQIHPYYRWWILYYLTVAQFVLAGAEALLSWLKSRKDRPEEVSQTAEIIPFATYRRILGAEPIPSLRPATLLEARGDDGVRC